ncbi:MAG: ATP-binding protein [Spirochaetes bacterium]|nr:ATP-binding protein [Spirochaetota bacterium]
MSNMNLIETLKVKSEGDNLVHRLNDIRIKAEPLLSKIIETFPEYTSHDITHCDRILNKLNSIIPDSLMERLNAYEIYFLVAGVYLHDIGMVNFPEFFNGEQLTKDSIREKHHLRSEEICVNKFKDLGIEDEHQAKIIGRICRGHRRENLSNNILFKPDRIYKNSSINIPLMAALVKIGDELDITFERTPQIIFDNMPPRDGISKYEWEKHLSISGVGLLPDDLLKIKCSANCKNPKIHRALKGLETKINNQLSDLPNHLHQYRESRNNIPRTFLMEIESEGYTPYDFRFSLQEKEIINLLMGDKLYKRKEESIRELLKNSLDACRFKKSLFQKKGETFTPLIEFKLTADKETIIVSDNGIGMDKNTIERYFLKIGQSFYRSNDFLEQGVDFTPVNELGIGILSCFMIANRITIETKMDDSDPILIEIDDISDYFFVKNGTKKTTGTTITLFLKNEAKIKEINLKEEIRHFARHLEFPVKIIEPNDEKHTIENIGFKPDSILGNQSKKYGYYFNKIENENLAGVIGILLKKEGDTNLKPTVNEWVPELRNIFDNKTKRFFISNEGIFVDHTNILPEWLKSNLIYIDINFKRNMLDFNVGRNEIIQNEKLINFKDYIKSEIIKVIQDYLNNIESNYIKSKIDFSKTTDDFFKNFIDTNYLYIGDGIKLPVELTTALKEIIYFKSISKAGINYVKYIEIMASVKPVRFITTPHYIDDLKTVELFSKCSEFSKRYHYILYYNDFILNSMFKSVHTMSLFEILGIDYFNELKGFIPKTWKLVKFKNYKTSKLMEFSGSYEETFLNRDNKFIDLLIKNKHNIKGNEKTAIEGFFRTLKLDLNKDFEKVFTKQKDILKWFVDANLIKKGDMNNYILTVDDFPQYFDTQ